MTAIGQYVGSDDERGPTVRMHRFHIGASGDELFCDRQLRLDVAIEVARVGQGHQRCVVVRCVRLAPIAPA